MSAREVDLMGGSPWGFRMHGGCDQNQPLRISRTSDRSAEYTPSMANRRRANIDTGYADPSS
ncbi:hypothetical protein TSAR_002026 [Trichomalopsis sarcophagae]|uniref:PDZ domain-containing protein n=1 Tax=Trichomalopsis sarcophagae TaxID=543379 RepID=A0A232FM36_9HYME|nr:hypothetical protein TSAR_002026 [Trichomalopsis sarcophagae]